MGELDFNYDDSLLQADDEEDVAVTDTQQQEQEDQEVLKCWRTSTHSHKTDYPDDSKIGHEESKIGSWLFSCIVIGQLSYKGQTFVPELLVQGARLTI